MTWADELPLALRPWKRAAEMGTDGRDSGDRSICFANDVDRLFLNSLAPTIELRDFHQAFYRSLKRSELGERSDLGPRTRCRIGQKWMEHKPNQGDGE